MRLWHESASSMVKRVDPVAAKLDKVHRAAERDIDMLTMPLGAAVVASVRRHAVNGVITPGARVRIMRDVETARRRIYGKRRGSPSPMLEMVKERAGEAVLLPVSDAVKTIRRTLKDDPDLLEALGDTDANATA